MRYLSIIGDLLIRAMKMFSLTGYITDFIYRSICQNCYFECISVIYSLCVSAHAHACVPIPMLQACVMQLDVLICFS